MQLCPICLDKAMREARLVKLVDDQELRTSHYLFDLRAFTSKLGVKPEQWPDYASDIYRDFDGFISDSEGNLISLNTQHLETYPEWYRDWANEPVACGAIPRLRQESRARVRVLATILKIKFSREAAMWGVRAANDNAQIAQ